jgi:hypothetical protein
MKNYSFGDRVESKKSTLLTQAHVRKVLKVLGILLNGKKWRNQLPIQGNDQPHKLMRLTN